MIKVLSSCLPKGNAGITSIATRTNRSMAEQDRSNMAEVFGTYPWLASFLKEQTANDERIRDLRNLCIDWFIFVTRLGEKTPQLRIPTFEEVDRETFDERAGHVPKK